MVRALHLPGTLARGRSAFTDYAEGPDLCAHWRARRGAHDFVAGATGRHAQLGLPLLLAARCHVHFERAAARRLSRRGHRLARVAAARRGRSPDDLQILYSVTGERRLDEYEVGWLPGYGGAAPVRMGNAASKQFQLDVYGEVMDTLHLARAAGLEPEPAAWRIQVALLHFLESNWQLPDEGIWEVRGPRRHFTHSKVMAWVAFDRGIKDAEAFGLDGPVERWREVRDAIHAQVCESGFDVRRNTFVQSYGSPHLDASLLLIPQVGFLPPDDPRVLGTVNAIEHNLVVDGLVLRYSTATDVDGLPPGEATFLPCSFWLADGLVLIGRREEGEALFERLLALSNDLGLLAEEYDTRERHMRGNFPQALTHMALINTARLLSIPMQQVKRASEKGERPAAVAHIS